MNQFEKYIGVPDSINCDSSVEYNSRALCNFCNEIGTTLQLLGGGITWPNRAELYIKCIKEAVKKDTKDYKFILVFWDFCVERRASINNLTAQNIFQLHCSNVYTLLKVEEGYTSNLCQYKWYNWWYFKDRG